ncbi:hypothetical protein HAX54_025654 [Datura stramonium]|uniref:Uncharacterized protein n=1 Tax=Datura stramonium TaxID=4076 RepID=A0ABS8UZV1_DATST|nr:hypothetical protein [Datura stramonium]
MEGKRVVWCSPPIMAGDNGGNDEGEERERKMVVRRRKKWREKEEKNDGVRRCYLGSPADRSRWRREKERNRGRKVGGWVVSSWLLAGVHGGKMGMREEDDVGEKRKVWQ